MPLGSCKLCGQERELQLSHILPAFVFRWLRSSSGNGHIRLGMEPNKRVQDGLKKHWLCVECEGRLNKSETAFANAMFHPYTSNAATRIPYGHWLIEFAVSLSWRVLRFYRDEDGLEDWAPEALARLDAAELVWRELLMGQRPHPGAYEQHVLPLDQIESASGELAPNLNRYVMRAVDMDLVRGGSCVYTYAKLGRFIFLGFIHEPNPRHWRGTKIAANEGVIGPRDYVLPRPFGEYLNGQARRMAKLLASVSPAQKTKINEAFRQNVDRYMASDAYRAMLADFSMFGDDAFSKPDPAA